MDAQRAALLLNAVSVLIIAITAALIYTQARATYHQTKATQEWNRRKAAHDLLLNASSGWFRVTRDALETRINIYDSGETYSTVASSLTREDHVRLDAVLNFLENMCIAVKNNVVDEDTMYTAFDVLLPAYWRWAQPYIRQNRAISPTLWIEADPFVQRWNAQQIGRQSKLIETGRPRI